MPTPPAGRTAVGLAPSLVTIARVVGQDAYEARFQLTPAGARPSEWLVITPRNALHPQHQPRHWLSDPADGWQGPADQLPRVVTCPVTVGGLNPDTEHRATVYVALRTNPDDVATERFTVVVTQAAPALPLNAPGTLHAPAALTREPRETPSPLRAHASSATPPVTPSRPHRTPAPLAAHTTPSPLSGRASPTTPGAADAAPRLTPTTPEPQLAPSHLSAPESQAPDATSTAAAATPVLERFCAACGRAFAETEKFCPKDGRMRQERKAL